MTQLSDKDRKAQMADMKSFDEQMLDGMLAYITDQNPSAALRWELGHRLIAETERDIQVRPAFELEL